MTWKKATAYKVFDQVIIKPVFLIPDLYPVSGRSIYRGPFSDVRVAKAVLEALSISQVPPEEFKFDLSNKEFLKDVGFKTLKSFHEVADQISIEVKSSSSGDLVIFRPLARSAGGGFEASTVEPLTAPMHDDVAIRSALVSALELATLAQPAPKPVRLKRRRGQRPNLDA